MIELLRPTLGLNPAKTTQIGGVDVGLYLQAYFGAKMSLKSAVGRVSMQMP